MCLRKLWDVSNYFRIIDLDFEIAQFFNLFLLYKNNIRIFMGD